MNAEIHHEADLRSCSARAATNDAFAVIAAASACARVAALSQHAAPPPLVRLLQAQPPAAGSELWPAKGHLVVPCLFCKRFTFDVESLYSLTTWGAGVEVLG